MLKKSLMLLGVLVFFSGALHNRLTKPGQSTTKATKNTMPKNMLRLLMLTKLRLKWPNKLGRRRMS